MNSRAELPDPATAPDLFEGVLTRRVIAYFIDLAVIAAIVGGLAIVTLISGFLTMGITWVTAPVIFAFAIVIYYGATLGSPRRATIGMQTMDLVLTPTRGLPLDGWRAFFHPLVFWVTCWILPPFSYVVALFTPRRQMLHDLLLGTLMLRRSPMEQHWRRYQRSGDDPAASAAYH